MVTNVVVLADLACKTSIDLVRLIVRNYFFVDMNVQGDVGNLVGDAIRNASISAVWPNVRRNVGIFV